MRITQVSYRQLQSGPNFSNVAIEAAVEVGERDTPEAALEAARIWVKEQLGMESDITDRRYEIEHLGYSLSELRNKTERERKQFEWYRERRDKVEAALLRAENSGADVDPEIANFLSDEIPF